MENVNRNKLKAWFTLVKRWKKMSLIFNTMRKIIQQRREVEVKCLLD